jgi:hypothetical protein
MTDTTGYVNYQDRVVVPDCPEAPGEHSHWLPKSDFDDEGKGSYICDLNNSKGAPSGEEIIVHIIP